MNAPVTPPIQIEYAARLSARRATLAELDRASARFSYLRLAVVACGVVVVGVGGWSAAPWLAFPAATFVVVAFLHARLLNRRDAAKAAIDFYACGLDRIAGRWAGRGRSGHRLQPDGHLYATDLDLFGRASLFDLLATVRSDQGEETLARWLLSPASPDVVRSRQAAVRELTPLLDLRELAAIEGQAVRENVRAGLLRPWAAAVAHLPGGGVRLLFPVLAAVSLATMVYWFAGTSGEIDQPASYVVLGAFVLQGAAAQVFRNRVHGVTHDVDEPAHELDVLAGLLRLLEREVFESEHLRHLQGRIGGATLASREIRRLSQYVAMLSSRENLLFALPASLVLWTTQWAFAVEAWRVRCGPRLTTWLDAVGEFEALLAFATFAAEHPDYAYPEFLDGPTRFVATGLAHPVLSADAVVNDVSLGAGSVRLLILSGSNMSGKSTLLRALGVTAVLAHAGAPVRARRLVLTPLAVGASINIQDSLVDHRSRFFTEIQRLKRIVDLATAEQGRVMFLIDEMLAGTNSHDRRVGAEALLRGLAATGAVGVATTHDLAIGAIVDHVDQVAANVHFEDQFEDGTLTFDYVLRPGLVQTSNALRLMQSIGLDV